MHLTIIPRARVGYQMKDSQLDASCLVGYLLISNEREWNNCFIYNDQEMLLISLCKNNQKTMKWSLFLGHGKMAHIPLWPLSQSNPWNSIIQ